MKRDFIYIIVIAVLALILVLQYHHKAEPYEVVKRDTILKVDTIRYKEPIHIYSMIIDTVFMHRDSLIYDTITNSIQIPIEQKKYSTEDYTAYVSGYMPKLDSISVVSRTNIINNTTVRKSGWGVTLGAQLGYGITPAGFQPYVGVGVTVGYTFNIGK